MVVAAVPVDPSKLQLEKGRSPIFGERLKHFLTLSDPRSVFASNKSLESAAALLSDSKAYARASPPERLRAKRLYLSAFDTRTGKRQAVIGRMSFQPWGNTILTASMLIFSRTAAQVAGMQLANQAFNAAVNVVNSTRSAEGKELFKSFASATAAAAGVGMLLKFGTKGPSFEYLQPFIPFAAVAAGQAVNVPLMRAEELKGGLLVSQGADEDDTEKSKKKKTKKKAKQIGYSRAAARKALREVWATRVFMAVPPMVSVPLAMDAIAANTNALATNPQLAVAITSLLVGLNLCVSTPLALAAFPQRGSISVSALEPELKAKLGGVGGYVTYEKGL